MIYVWLGHQWLCEWHFCNELPFLDTVFGVAEVVVGAHQLLECSSEEEWRLSWWSA